ncbi:MAG: hypothetical protein WCP39_03675, partial [Chlamydiota bacterium]
MFNSLREFYFKKKTNPKADSQKLIRKIHELPHWALQQIEKELSFFSSSKISKERIKENLTRVEKTFPNQNLLLFHIQIKDNKILYTPFSSHPRLQKWIAFLRKTLKHLPIPDIDFVIGIHDTYDDSRFQELIDIPIFAISKKQSSRKICLFPHVEWLSHNDFLF